MKCEGARELFSEYLEGRVDYALTVTLRSHFEECDSCRRDYGLFSRAWVASDSLPEVSPPANFRHDVVMRAARLQHEKSRAGRKATWSPGAIFGKLIPVRTIAVTAAAAVLAFALIKGPSVFHKMDVQPPNISAGVESPSLGRRVMQQPPESLDPGLKEQWRSRKIARNTLWITVDPKPTRDSQMLYRVLISLNPYATEETFARVWARVWVLPPNEFGMPNGRATELWQGNILDSSPLLVPVVQGAGESVNLLVTWRFRGRSFAQLVYIPSHAGARDAYDFSIDGHGNRGKGLYSALQSISDDYGMVIIANATMQDKDPGVAFGRGNLEESLRSVLKPAGLDWLAADHAIYVDRKLIADNE